MELFAVGFNYNSAPLALRERVALPCELLSNALTNLRHFLANKHLNDLKPDIFIISTCNRTEFYCSVKREPELVQAWLLDWIYHYHQIAASELLSHLYFLSKEQAIRHLFRVACGLDSMVLGEAQILGQIKKATQIAQQADTLGKYLHHLLQKTFSVAKDVRSHTQIGVHSTSMASAGVKLAKRIFGDLSQRQVLFVGAGEMIQQTATYFAAEQPLQLTIANRSPERAQQLIQTLGQGKAISLIELPNELPKADIIISCTASPLPIIGLGMVQSAKKIRKNKPMFMLDLAVPRDIEHQVSKLSDIFLYTVDDLSQIVQQGKQQRVASIQEADQIINQHVAEFLKWTDELTIVPVIQNIRDQGEEIVQYELAHGKKLLNRGNEALSTLELMANRLSAKFLHGSMRALHEAPEQEREILLKWLPKIFNLKNTDSNNP